jgi:hypothetical protein
MPTTFVKTCYVEGIILRTAYIFLFAFAKETLNDLTWLGVTLS